MADSTFNLGTFKKNMDLVIDQLKKEFTGLRTGRASVSLVEPVFVDAYGSKMPMAQVGTISVPESRQVTISVWDKGLVLSVEKAIREANLGVNPVVDGQTVRVPIPQLTEERRKELVKLAAKYGEQSKISIRSVRKEAMDNVKSFSSISEDETDAHNKDIQKLTDDYTKEVDVLLASKEKDIMTI